MRQQEPTAATWNLDQIVAELRASRETIHNIRHQGLIRELPSRKVLHTVVEGLCAALFPTHYGRSDLNETTVDQFRAGHTLNQTLPLLQDHVRRGLLFASDAGEQDDLARSLIVQTG